MQEYNENILKFMQKNIIISQLQKHGIRVVEMKDIKKNHSDLFAREMTTSDEIKELRGDKL